MTKDPKPTHTSPGGLLEVTGNLEDEMVNDSLGTVSIADSTGVEDAKETGDAKVGNTKTRED